VYDESELISLPSDLPNLHTLMKASMSGSFFVMMPARSVTTDEYKFENAVDSLRVLLRFGLTTATGYDLKTSGRMT
jgi:hypothetical protein